MQVIGNWLSNDHTLPEQIVLGMEAIVLLLELCLRATCCQTGDKFYKQKDGMAVGNMLVVVSNISIDRFKKLVLDTGHHCCGCGVSMVCWLWSGYMVLIGYRIFQ
jgi:hypothetical protein